MYYRSEDAAHATHGLAGPVENSTTCSRDAMPPYLAATAAFDSHLQSRVYLSVSHAGLPGWIAIGSGQRVPPVPSWAGLNPSMNTLLQLLCGSPAAVQGYDSPVYLSPRQTPR